MWFNSTNYSINNHSLWFNSKDYSIQNNTLWFNSIHSPFVDFGPLIGPYLVSIFVQVPNFSILGPLEPWEQFSSWCRINHKGHIIVYFPQIWLQVWLRLLSSFWSPLHVGAVPVWNPRLGLKVLNFRKFDLKIYSYSSFQQNSIKFFFFSFRLNSIQKFIHFPVFSEIQFKKLFLFQFSTKFNSKIY